MALRKYRPKVGSKKLHIPAYGKSMSFERYVLRFDQLNTLKSINYTFGEKK